MEASPHPVERLRHSTLPVPQPPPAGHAAAAAHLLRQRSGQWPEPQGMRFSSSAQSSPCAITPASPLRPITITLVTSTWIDFPEPGTVAETACIGAVGRERRTQAVRIAESATDRSASLTKGNRHAAAAILSLRASAGPRALAWPASPCAYRPAARFRLAGHGASWPHLRSPGAARDPRTCSVRSRR